MDFDQLEEVEQATHALVPAGHAFAQAPSGLPPQQPETEATPSEPE